jgi:hypothetical protein
MVALFHRREERVEVDVNDVETPTGHVEMMQRRAPWR